MKKHVVIFEARGGSDKSKYGYRRDTYPIVESLKARGWTAEVIFYSDENRGEIYRYTIDKADAYVSRINPGNLKDETGYFQMLRELVHQGVKGLPHPDVMINYGAKNVVERLKGTALVPEDVYCYYEYDELKHQFPQTLARGERVLKQNRGSTGEGIWRVQLKEPKKYKDVAEIPEDAVLRLTEARDNHVEEKTMGEFIEFCYQYLEGDSGLILDMPFLPRIKEGEIRVLMLRDKAVSVVHKKPDNSADAFSATLFSGATYRYDKPEQWQEMVDEVEASIPMLQARLGGYALPLLWTADFILDTDDQGNDVYVLGEINSSCVGFSTNLELSENIADEIMNLIEAESVINSRFPAFRI